MSLMITPYPIVISYAYVNVNTLRVEGHSHKKNKGGGECCIIISDLDERAICS